jgi:hypothetical protein
MLALPWFCVFGGMPISDSENAPNDAPKKVLFLVYQKGLGWPAKWEKPLCEMRILSFSDSLGQPFYSPPEC